MHWIRKKDGTTRTDKNTGRQWVTAEARRLLLLRPDEPASFRLDMRYPLDPFPRKV